MSRGTAVGRNSKLHKFVALMKLKHTPFSQLGSMTFFRSVGDVSIDGDASMNGNRD
jgi:hypothetical protein